MLDIRNLKFKTKIRIWKPKTGIGKKTKQEIKEKDKIKPNCLTRPNSPHRSTQPMPPHLVRPISPFLTPAAHFIFESSSSP
jgi:hypothetical protein